MPLVHHTLRPGTLEKGSMMLMVLFMTSLWSPADAQADPLYADCAQIGGNLSWTHDGQEEMYFYISSTFGEAINGCQPTINPGDSLTEGQARSVIIAAAETWNTESRGRTLIFDGTLATTSPTVACSLLMQNPTAYKTPAVFVRFNPGCTRDGNGCANDTPLARVAPINSQCTEAGIIQLVVYGTNYDDDDNHEDKGKASIDDCIEVADDGDPDSRPEVRRNRFYVKTDYDADGLDAIDLPSLLLHELGHVLGHGHAEDSTNATTKVAPAVMSNEKETWPAPYRPSSNPNFLGYWHARRHLYPYDTDCLNLSGDSMVGDTTRDLEVYWRGYRTSSPVGWGSITTDGWYSTAKGFTSGGSIRDASGTTVIGFFEQYQNTGYFHHGGINNDGTLPLTWASATAHTNIVGTALDRINVPPTIFSPYESSDTDKRAIALFPQYETNSNMVTAVNLPVIEPPRWTWQRSSTLWASGSASTESVKFCPTTGTCTALSAPQLQTHLPVSTAYDAASGQTMVARVETSKLDPDANDRIWLHPGFQSLDSRLLRSGRELDLANFTTLPSAPTPFVYLGESETSPALSCGPAWTQYYGVNNCLLAWVDRGGPMGHILYTYFRYDAATDTLTWHHTVYRLNNAWTVSRPSAAFFAGAFWLAYKGLGDSPDVYVTSRPHNNYSGWSTPTAFGQT